MFYTSLTILALVVIIGSGMLTEHPLFMKVSHIFAAVIAASLLGSGAAVAQRGSALFGATLRPEQIPVVPAIYMTQPPSQTPTGYTPAQVAHAYGLDHLSGTGTGQTIALIEFHGSATLQNDLDTFSQTFNMNSTTVAVYAPHGHAMQASPVWALQTTLDVEWAHAAAPGASIMVVLAKSDRLSSMLDAVDYAVQQGATQVVMNWGGVEFSAEQKYDFHFAKTGVTFIAASGDVVHGLQWPATSPNVISVGGTKLKLDEQGNVRSEVAWQYSNGGSSAYEPVPTWQSTWQNTQGRGVPDVSYLADPDFGVSIYMSRYGNKSGWFTVGGSGVGADQWAGLYALAGSGSLATTAVALPGTTGGNQNQNQGQGAGQQGNANSNTSGQGNSGRGAAGQNGNGGNSAGGGKNGSGGAVAGGGNGGTNSNQQQGQGQSGNSGQKGNNGANSSTTGQNVANVIIVTPSSPVETLYHIATASYSTDFRDIVLGSNGNYTATDGYDFVTGLGSPLADALVPEIESQ